MKAHDLDRDIGRDCFADQSGGAGRWAVCRTGRSPIDIMDCDDFCVEVEGKMRPTRMEFENHRGYHSVDGYELKSGLRAALVRH
jgi:hypothetical protein